MPNLTLFNFFVSPQKVPEKHFFLQLFKSESNFSNQKPIPLILYTAASSFEFDTVAPQFAVLAATKHNLRRRTDGKIQCDPIAARKSGSPSFEEHCLSSFHVRYG